jgi:hypothetical protein
MLIVVMLNVVVLDVVALQGSFLQSNFGFIAENIGVTKGKIFRL